MSPRRNIIDSAVKGVGWLRRDMVGMTRRMSRSRFIVLAGAGSLAACTGGGGSMRGPGSSGSSHPVVNTDLSGVALFPASNPWNTPVDTLPVDPQSAQIILDHCGGTPGVCAKIIVDTSMPYNVVSGLAPGVSFAFTYAAQSDPGPYPVLTSMTWENGPYVPGVSKGDHHLLVVDRDNNRLYELYQAYQAADGSWHAAGGATWDLASNSLRPDCWTSADAAGLPILPGLVRYEEVAAGAINHALRFTLSVTRQAFVHPATHYTLNGPKAAGWAPMGARLRLKASFDMSTFSPAMQVILTALKKYGMFLADNGGPYSLNGVGPDERWVTAGIADYPDVFVLHDKTYSNYVYGTDFEVVQMGPLVTTC